MKQLFRDFFSFSSMERKGIVLLILIIMIITGLNYHIAHRSPAAPADENSRLISELRTFERQLSLKNDSEVPHPVILQEAPADLAGLFPFDPNEVSAEDLRHFGLSSKVAGTLIRYRERGGKFYRKEDLLKIYGMDHEVYARLSPYVKIKKDTGYQARVITAGPVDRDILININLADSDDFERLPGIGPVLARRITRYRSLLGGFYDIFQLREVYGLTDSVFRGLSARFYADTVFIRKLNLNDAGEGELAKHPYIGRYTARGIILYRSKAKHIMDFNELILNGLIKPEDLEKVRKYLVI